MAGSSDKVFSVILGGCGHRFLPSIIVSSAVKDLTSPTNAVLLDASSSSVFAVVFVFVIASMPEHNSATSPSDMVLDLDPQTAEGRLVLLSESEVKVYSTSFSLPNSSEQLRSLIGSGSPLTERKSPPLLPLSLTFTTCCGEAVPPSIGQPWAAATQGAMPTATWMQDDGRLTRYLPLRPMLVVDLVPRRTGVTAFNLFFALPSPTSEAGPVNRTKACRNPL